MPEHILCVDDEASMRLLVSTFLEGQGYQVRTATDGLDALHAVQESTPDLIITDVNMPGLNGFELTRRLRAHRKTARIPIIMLSGKQEVADMVAAYAEGADDYVPKPVEFAVLIAKIGALLRRTRADGAPAPARGKVIVLLHAKGGVGTTTIAVNAATALAAGGPERVALLDLDLEFGSAAMMLDVHPDRTLADFRGVAIADLDEATFGQGVLEHASGVRMVVGTTTPEQAELVTVTTVQQTIDRLREAVDYVLVDTPRSFSETTLATLDVADLIGLVVTPHVMALKATADCLDILSKLQVPAHIVLQILNRTTSAGLSNAQVAEFLRHPPDVVVPYTPQLDEAADAGRPLVLTQPGNTGASQLRALAATLAARSLAQG